MATWTNIDDTFLEPGKPVRSVDGLALRDNPIAIAEGAAGAPKVKDLALDTTATNTGRNWVLARTALSSVGAVGTYAILRNEFASSFEQGDTASGANLVYAAASGGAGPSVSSPSGAWRVMGFCSGSSDTVAARTTLWLRIS